MEAQALARRRAHPPSMWPLCFEHASCTASRSRTRTLRQQRRRARRARARRASQPFERPRRTDLAAAERHDSHTLLDEQLAHREADPHAAVPLVPPKTRACLNSPCVLVASAISSHALCNGCLQPCD